MMITDDYNVASPILEVNSYYPFGLQQKGIGLIAAGTLHNYKNTFQKQELNEALGVDLYEFKYRMDDPQIGRFWQVDPLADKYAYNSTYAFSENKVTGDIELEGLESARISMRGVPLDQQDEVLHAATKASEKPLKHATIFLVGVVTEQTELIKPIFVDIVTGVGVLISALREASSNNAVSGEVPSRGMLLSNGTFDGKQDTKSKTGKEALRKAKEQNGIPRSQQPYKVIKPNTPEGSKVGLDNRNEKQYEYTNSKGEKVSVRKDKAASYGAKDGIGNQEPHYNAGKTGKKLKQHHYILR